MDTTTPQTLTPVYCVTCGAVAFRLRCSFDDALEGVVMNAATVQYDDGRLVVDDDGPGVTGSVLSCQSCGSAEGFSLAPVPPGA